MRAIQKTCRTDRSFIRCVAVAMLLCLPLTARAKPDEERAKALLQEGSVLFRQKAYARALDKFLEAATLSSSPRIQLNLALTREQLGQLAPAAMHYDKFLGTVDHVAYPDRVKATRDKLDELRRKLGSVSIRCAVKGALVSVGGRPAGKTPLEHRLYGEPGEVRLTVKKDGHHAFERELTLAAGGHLQLDVTLRRRVTTASLSRPASRPVEQKPGVTPVPAPVKPLVWSRPFYKKWWFWTAVGVVAVGATTGIVASQTGGSDRLPVGELPPLPPR